MSAVADTVERAALAPLSGEMHEVRWTERDFVFEIRCADRQVCEMARSIFPMRTSAGGRNADRRWTIEPADEGGELSWIVSGHSDISSMIPSSAPTREQALLRIELDALDWLINSATDVIAVHAALLTRNGRGIVIVGPSFAGKSTLATALWRSGWALMSDDLVFINVDQCAASPAPRRVSLRYGSKTLVGESAWNEISDTPSCIETDKGLFFHPHEVSGNIKPEITALSAVFFLARRNVVTGAAEARVMNPAKAAVSLLPYAFNIRTMPFVEGLRRITPLLNSVPAFDLGRGELPAMIAAVESAIG